MVTKVSAIINQYQSPENNVFYVLQYFYSCAHLVQTLMYALNRWSNESDCPIYQYKLEIMGLHNYLFFYHFLNNFPCCKWRWAKHEQRSNGHIGSFWKNVTYSNCTFWYGRQHIIAREDLSDCIPSGHRQRVHWTEKCILNRHNHDGNHMIANEAPSNIIISFVKCTSSYLFWYKYEI